MTKREYAEEIARIIDGEVTEVKKANGITLTGVTKHLAERNISPNVYIDSMYEELTIGEAAAKVKEIIEASQLSEDFDVSQITDWMKVVPNLTARLYNRSTDAEVKRDASKYGFDDLIIVPVIDIKKMHGSCKVTSRMLDMWQKSSKEVIDVAMSNIKYDFEMHGILETLVKMECIPENERETYKAMIKDEEKMYIVSNPNRFYGAISVIGAKRMLKRTFPEGYIVIPSSIHEVLVTSINCGKTYTELAQEIEEVNHTQLPPYEWLSDRPYYFPAEEK